MHSVRVSLVQTVPSVARVWSLQVANYTRITNSVAGEVNKLIFLNVIDTFLSKEEPIILTKLITLSFLSIFSYFYFYITYKVKVKLSP
jgi:hypothetical protein